MYNTTINPTYANIQVSQMDVLDDVSREDLIMERYRATREVMFTTVHMGRAFTEDIPVFLTYLQSITANTSGVFMHAAPAVQFTDGRERNHI